MTTAPDSDPVLSPECLSALFDLAPAGLAVLDRQGRVVQVNARGLALLGDEGTDLGARPLGSLFHPEDESAWAGHLERARTSGRQESFESAIQRGPEGGRVLRLSTVFCTSAPSPFYLVSLSDISGEIALRREIDSERVFTREVLNALPSQLAVLDRRGVIRSVNRAWRLFGEANDAAEWVCEGVGADYLAACRGPDGSPVEDAAEAVEGILGVMENRRPLFTLEYPCHSPDQERWFQLTASPLGTAEAGVVIEHIDITARRQAQQQAHFRQQALAHAARLNTVGTLASGLAHEIAQPLTAIGHFNYTALTLLGREDHQPQEVKALLEETEAEIDRAAAVIARLKRLIRRGSARREPADVRRTASEAVDLVSHFAARKTVRVELHCPEHPAPARVDRVQITQVIVNLLCNSIEAIDRTGAEPRRVQVRVAPGDREVRVTVQDTGPGIEPERDEHIFDVLKADRSGDAGMGLAVGRSIAEAHGGRLWAEPNPGGGAVLHLSLPTEGG